MSRFQTTLVSDGCTHAKTDKHESTGFLLAKAKSQVIIIIVVTVVVATMEVIVVTIINSS